MLVKCWVGKEVLDEGSGVGIGGQAWETTREGRGFLVVSG